MKSIFILSLLFGFEMAHAAPTDRLVGMAQENASCSSGYQIYSPGEIDGKRLVTCLIWSELVEPRVRRKVEEAGAAMAFLGEQSPAGFVVASVSVFGGE